MLRVGSLFLCLWAIAEVSAEEMSLVVDEIPEDPELGYYGANLTATTLDGSNTTLGLLAAEEEEGFAGRQLAEAKKPKRKFCNTSAYGLKGDYAYEACGSFCKSAKAVNQ